MDKKIRPSLLIFITSLLVSPVVYSAAGDSISTTATINFDLGGVPSSTVSSVTFIEDRIVNFIVNDDNGGAVVPVISDMTDAVLQFTVTNTGNAVHDFLLTALNTSPNPYGLPVDNFDPSTTQVFVESGGGPGYQSGQDVVVYIDELIPLNSRVVYVVSDLPTISSDDVSAIALIAQVAEGGSMNVEGAAINADDNGRISPEGIFSNTATPMSDGVPNSIVDSPASMETVFNDPAGLNVEDISTIVPTAQDVVGNGQHSDTGAYQVTSPVLMTKSVTVIDTVGGTDPHPGATLRYQIVVTVAGNTAIDKLIIADAIPVNTTYVAESMLLNGVVQTDADDSPATDFSRTLPPIPAAATSIEVDLGENDSVGIIPGAVNTIIFDVTIN